MFHNASVVAYLSWIIDKLYRLHDLGMMVGLLCIPTDEETLFRILLLKVRIGPTNTSFWMARTIAWSFVWITVILIFELDRFSC